MNELIFLVHVVIVIAFALLALRLGRETLISWVALQAILANLLVLKEITLFGMQVTASDVFAVGVLLGLNLLQEYFGREVAGKTVWVCLYLLLFFTAMTVLHILYMPSMYDTAHGAYLTILRPAPRLVAASLLTGFITQNLDVRIFGFLKNYAILSLPVRCVISFFLSQFFDTLSFTLLGLSGLVTSLVDVFIVSFLVKLVIMALMTPCTLLAQKMLPKPVTL
jgi:uncharacterized integral membrane protein (TIGR00697 family)